MKQGQGVKSVSKCKKGEISEKQRADTLLSVCKACSP